MEFGPRALGAGSILGDPRSPTMQSALNLKVKYRESFRPCAPSVLRGDVADWFELDRDSPYMLLVAAVNKEHRCEMKAEEQGRWGFEKLNVP
jgi:carbamoyltransferase